MAKEMGEVNRVYEKYLKTMKLSKKKFENVFKMLYLFSTTVKCESHGDSKRLAHYVVQYDYFKEKILDFHEMFDETQLRDERETLSQRYSFKASYTASGSDLMFNNFCFLAEFMFSKGQSYDYSKIRNKSFPTVALEVYSTLFGNLENLKETEDVPKLHALLQRNFCETIMPAAIGNIMRRYEKDLLNDAFQQLLDH